MPKYSFYLVDVFAEEKYAGNQLAVIRNAAELSVDQMQRIANETHFSETTFILSDQPRSGGYDVRIFTPQQEVPFAGHPTLGTAYVIKNYIASGNPAALRLNLGIGQIPVTFQNGVDGQEVAWMKQNPPVFGEKFSIEELAPILQLPKESFDGRFPIQEVSTGMPFILVPLKTLKAVQSARVNLSLLEKNGYPSTRWHPHILPPNLPPRKHPKRQSIRGFIRHPRRPCHGFRQRLPRRLPLQLPLFWLR